MQPHIYVGQGYFCLRCFKQKIHPDHITQDEHIQAMSVLPVLAIKQIEKDEEEKAKQLEDYKLSSTCQGHECPKCNNIWKHDRACRNPDSKGLCFTCAGDSAVLVNRRQNLEIIKETSYQHIGPRETKEIELEHADFIVLNIFKNPDGSDNENWFEVWSKHYKNLESLIEKFRIQQSVALRKKAEKQFEDTQKLSPEEREQYERDAKKNKKKNEAKVASNKESKKKAYDKMLASIANTLRASNPKLNEEQARAIAEKSIVKPKDI